MYYVQTPDSAIPLRFQTINSVRKAAYEYFKSGHKGVWIIEGNGETILAFSKENRVFAGDYEIINDRGTIRKSS